MAVRFLHSADWQIGKVFADLVEHDADKAALLKRERTAVVERQQIVLGEATHGRR